MTITRVLAADLLLFLLGIGVLPVLRLASNRRELVRRGPVALLLGFAFIGSVGAILEPLGIAMSPAALAVAATISLAIGAAYLARLHRDDTARHGGDQIAVIDPGPRRSGHAAVLLGTSIAVLALLAVVASRAFLVLPVTGYDGWAIWAMKARALADLGWADPLVFTNAAYEHAHLEYPLALPTINAYGLRAAGDYDSRLLVVQALVLGIAGIAALWSLLQDRVPAEILLPLLASLAIAPAFHRELASAYADVPVALFISAALVSGARWLLEDGARPRWLAVATIFLVAAALTKSEGLLFALAVQSGLLLTASRRRRAVFYSIGVVFAALIPWQIYTRVHGLSHSDYDLARSFDVAWVVARSDRGIDAIARLLVEAGDPSRYALLLLIGVLAITASAVAGSRKLALFVSCFGAVSLAGLVWIYILSEIELDLYLEQTANRVVASVVFGCAAVAPLLAAEITDRVGRDGSRPSRSGRS